MKITDFKNIYFACTGNTCRSPMAERIFLEEMGDRGVSMHVGSRKAYVSDFSDDEFDGGIVTSAKVKAQELMSEGTAKIIMANFNDKGFVQKHRARYFKYEELERAGLVLCMDKLLV